jgi:hypothetical protein
VFVVARQSYFVSALRALHASGSNDDLLGPGNQLILYDFYPDLRGNGQWPEAAPPFSSGGMLLVV